MVWAEVVIYKGTAITPIEPSHTIARTARIYLVADTSPRRRATSSTTSSWTAPGPHSNNPFLDPTRYTLQGRSCPPRPSAASTPPRTSPPAAAGHSTTSLDPRGPADPSLSTLVGGYILGTHPKTLTGFLRYVE